MNPKFLLPTTVLALAAALAPIGSARAGQIMLDQSGFISGTESFVDSFNVTTAGTLTVTLSNIGWPDTINGLSFFVSSANGLVAPVSSAASETINVSPGLVSVHWFGQSSGAGGLGLYGIDCQFQPCPINTVPLPPSLLLMASGLITLMLWRRGSRPQPLAR